VSDITYRQNILVQKLTALDGLICAIEKINDNRMGDPWSRENIGLVNSYIDRMKSLDDELPPSTINVMADSSDTDIRLLVDQMKQKLLRARQLISIYIAKIEGSKSLVQDKIGRINKARLIRGYRFRNNYHESAGQLC
jgi:hypothetical protein